MNAPLDFNHREKRPSFADRINARIDAALVANNATRPERDYLGGSRLGDACARRLQYGYLKAPKDEGAGFSGQSLWIFAVGHALEDLAVKPSIRNVDEAMRRRLHMVPFTVTIPPARRDKRLADRLLAERDGILAWALAGCLEWQRAGLRPPAAVMAATEDYFEAEDAVGRWIEERCIEAPAASATSAMLYGDWKAWAEANGEWAGSQKRFSEALTARGYERRNTSSARGFRGIGLRDSNSDLFSGE